MMPAVFEIINPSDKVLISGDDFQAVAVATCILGQGKYGLSELPEGQTAMPLFLFGGHDEWFVERFGHDFETAMNLYSDERRPALIDALDSCFIGEVADFESYHKALELIGDASNRDKFREHWKESRRSSLNDICGRAAQYAASLRKATI